MHSYVSTTVKKNWTCIFLDRNKLNKIKGNEAAVSLVVYCQYNWRVHEKNMLSSFLLMF